MDEGTPAKEYIVKDEYRPTPVSRYHSPGGQGVYGGPKNRPTMLGQSRLILEETGRSRTRDSISGLSQQGAGGTDGQELNRGKVPMCREEGMILYYTPSTHRYGPQHEDNRDGRKYDMGYDTPRVVDRGLDLGSGKLESDGEETKANCLIGQVR